MMRHLTLARWAAMAAFVTAWHAPRAQAPAAPRIPTEAFAVPTGPYAVGTIDTLWVDARRGERHTKAPDDKRHVPVRIWYPAVANGQAVANYVLRPEEFPVTSPFSMVRHVTTHAVVGAPVAPNERKYPVLLYNPGGGWNRFTATFVTEELASRGYVVVAVDHLGFNQTTSLANGYQFTGDTLGFPTPTNTDLRADALASWDYLEQVLFPTWVADAQFALDQLQALDRAATSPLRGRLALERIGAFGWSFGGATAVDLLIRDPRVKAAIDQDGQLFGRGRMHGTTRPVMLMHNGSDPVGTAPLEQRPIIQEMMKAVEGWDEAFRNASTGDVYDVRIARTGHGHFSDLTLFYPADSTQLPARRGHEVITAFTVAFFDRYLRGKPSALLDGNSSAYPEVTLRPQKRATAR